MATAPLASGAVIELEASTVLLQWAVGGMAFCWFTTRRREVGLGYGWLLRGVFAVLAFGGGLIGLRMDDNPVRDVAGLMVGAACLVVLAISIARRRVGVRGQRAEHDRRSRRVAAMTGIHRQPTVATDGSAGSTQPCGTSPSAGTPDEPGAPDDMAGGSGLPGRSSDGSERDQVGEFPPLLDLLPVAIGLIGLVAAAVDTDANVTVALVRTLAGALFLGAVTDAMLLGHWYLVQPGLPRRLLHELVDALAVVWPIEVVAMLLPTGMISVWSGAVDDGWGGTLGWFWAACAVTTMVLVVVTKAALREREYSAVMAATGLLYLAILTAFGTDLVARAVLSS